MAKKQTTVNETVAAAPRRAAKPRAPRVTAATHSKTASTESVLATPVTEPAVPVSDIENPHDAIARLAYSYWEARGQKGGSAMDDWFRAEYEYGQPKIKAKR